MENQDKTPESIAHAMLERSASPEKRATPQPMDFSSRTLGCIFLFGGILEVWWGAFLPISNALDHVEHVYYPGKLVFATPFLLIFGLVYTIFGESCRKILGPTSKFSKWGWIILAVSFIIGLVYDQCVRAYIRSLGYDV